jgi:uncharacterized protein YndB with AHSA1/START domain
MTNAGNLKIVSQGDREIVMTRSFNAPRHLVFDAFTKPELLKLWFGRVGEWSLAVCEIDLRVGGAFRFVWRGPDCPEMGMRGIYREIVVPERIVSTEQFDQSWYPGGAIGTLVLAERGGKTFLTQTVLYDSTEARDAVMKSPMEQGVSAGYKHLDEVLASMLSEQTREGGTKS